MKTKKAGSAGRYGPRYGAKIRKKVRDVEKHQKAKQQCPVCKIGNVKRLAKGIFKCKKCNAKIAGKAYTIK